jgi:hypothetical protein
MMFAASAVEPRPAPLATAGFRRLSVPATICAGLVLLTLYFFRLSLAQTTNAADIAGLVLCAQDLVRGNWLLHGWALATDSLWLTDMLVYGAGVLVRGLDPVLLHLIPSVMSVGLVAAAVAAAVAGRTGALAVPAALLAVLPIVFPSTMMLEVLMGPFHTAAIIVALLSAVVLHYAQQQCDRPRRRWGLFGLAFLLLSAGTFSDPYTRVLAMAPIALVSVARALAAGRAAERWRRLLPLGAVAAAWYGAAAIAWWIRYLGGATLDPFAPTIVAYSKIGGSISNLLLALLQVGGGDIFGRSVDARLVSAGLRAAYLAAGCVATWLVLRDEIRGLAGTRAREEDWLTVVLAASAAIALVANVLGTMNLDTRYRLPLVVIMGVVLARRFGAAGARWIGSRRALAAAAGVLIVLLYPGSWGHYLHPYVPKRPSPYLVLGRWLDAHGLDDGYGGYWEASIVTVATKGAVRVRPVVSTKVHQPGFGAAGTPPDSWRLTRIKFNSKDTWYAGTPARFFVVFDDASEWDRLTGVDRDVATKTYGPPHHVYHVDRFTVLAWD